MIKLIKKYLYRKNKESTPLFSERESAIIRAVKPYTMTSNERIISLIDAVDYVETNNIEGSIVECGVWKGGSIMAAIMALQSHENSTRDIYLFDTFDGMSKPGADDIDLNNNSAHELMAKETKSSDSKIWCYSSLEETKKNVYSTGYDRQKINFRAGPVESTLKNLEQLNKIAILRLDTDWYKSTKIELEYLFPILVRGGIIIIDDYGHWKGARKAVDEYFSINKIKIFLSRIDYTGRIGIKTE